MSYYIIYPLFYLFSLLPWRVMYWISDGFYGLIFYVFKYRRDVVMQNLSIAFPEKTEDEKTAIAKAFYKTLVDTFIETIKLISASDRDVQKRIECHTQQVLNDLHPHIQQVQLISGHFFNWEFANYCIALFSKYPFLGVYMPVANKAINRLISKVRCRYGTILLPATDFKNAFLAYKDKPHAIGLASDQNPGDARNAYWMYFFSRPAPFVKGPEKNARLYNSAVVYGDFYKTKRGHYRVDLKLITANPNDFAEGQITRALSNCVEAAVRQRPANYLWSHRRWKHVYDPAVHGDLIVTAVNDKIN